MEASSITRLPGATQMPLDAKSFAAAATCSAAPESGQGQRRPSPCCTHWPPGMGPAQAEKATPERLTPPAAPTHARDPSARSGSSCRGGGSESGPAPVAVHTPPPAEAREPLRSGLAAIPEALRLPTAAATPTLDGVTALHRSGSAPGGGGSGGAGRGPGEIGAAQPSGRAAELPAANLGAGQQGPTPYGTAPTLTGRHDATFGLRTPPAYPGCRRRLWSHPQLDASPGPPRASPLRQQLPPPPLPQQPLRQPHGQGQHAKDEQPQTSPSAASPDAPSPVWRTYRMRRVGCEGCSSDRSHSGGDPPSGGAAAVTPGQQAAFAALRAAVARRGSGGGGRARPPGPWLRIPWGSNRAIPWMETPEERRAARKAQRQAAVAASAASAASGASHCASPRARTPPREVLPASSTVRVPGKGVMLVGRAIAPSALYRCLKVRGALASGSGQQAWAAVGAASAAMMPAPAASAVGTHANAAVAAAAAGTCAAAVLAAPEGAHYASRQATPGAGHNRGGASGSDGGSGSNGGGNPYTGGSPVPGCCNGRGAGGAASTPPAAGAEPSSAITCSPAWAISAQTTVGAARAAAATVGSSTPPVAMTPLSAARVAAAAAAMGYAAAAAAAAVSAVASAPTTTLGLSRVLAPDSQPEHSANGVLSAVGLDTRPDLEDSGRHSPILSAEGSATPASGHSDLDEGCQPQCQQRCQPQHHHCQQQQQQQRSSCPSRAERDALVRALRAGNAWQTASADGSWVQVDASR